MRVVVCYPPDFSIPTMPFGALPLFNACLRQAGHESLVLDLAAISFNRLARRESVEGMLGLLDSELERLGSVPEGAEAARDLARLRAIPTELALDAEAALARLRQPRRYFDPDWLRHDTDALFGVVQMLGALRPRLDPRNRDFPEAFHGLLGNEAMDPWLQAYDDVLLERLRNYGPELVAITIPFATQVFGALRFSQWVRHHFPDARVVVGGTGISDAEHVLLTDPRFFDHVDFAVTGEGEDALPALASALEGNGDLSGVPALFYRSGSEIVTPSDRPFVDMNESPIPDFTGIDYELYATPEKIASLTTSRGCYYGKCTFCPESFRLRFRRRGSSRAWEDVRHIAEEQGIRNFMFWDPLTPPAMLQEISAGSAEEGVEIHWMAQVKFDKVYTDPEYVRVLKDGGCEWLQFGFESGVQRVLDDMDKGNDLRRIDVILERLREADIQVGVFWFIGFPTEHEEDARETWRYLVRRRDRIAFSGYIGVFGMGHDVQVFNDPARFGIDVIVSESGDATYKRHDGRDWDFAPLHETFFGRNDIRWIEGGAALLYSSRARAEIARLSSRNHLSPPGFIRPGAAHEALSVPPTNGFHTHADGTTAYAYVANSARIHRLEGSDPQILEQVCTGRTLNEIATETGCAQEEVVQRLQCFVDLGILTTRPMPPGEPIEGEAARSAVG